MSQDDDYKFRFLGKTIQLPGVDMADPQQALRDGCEQRMATLRGMLIQQLGDAKCLEIYHVMKGMRHESMTGKVAPCP